MLLSCSRELHQERSPTLEGIISKRLRWSPVTLLDDTANGIQDDPRHKIHGKLNKEEPSWETELQRLVKIRKILDSTDVDLKVSSSTRFQQDVANSLV